AEESLRAHVDFHAFDHLIGAASQFHVAKCFRIHREVTDGRAIFGSHIANGGAIRDGHRVEAGAEELDELIHDAFLAKHLRDGEDKIGGGDAIAQFAVQFEADHIRQEHVHRLAEHHGFSLDAAHGRDDAEVAECFLSPLQKFIALAVALELDFRVALQSVGCGEEIHLNGVVNDEVNRYERIDLLRVAAEASDRGAHGGQIHDCGDAGEVLHNDARRKKWNAGARALRLPRGDVLHMALSNLLVVALTESRLEHDTDRKRKPLEVRETRFFERVEAIDHVFLFPRFQYVACFKEIVHRKLLWWWSPSLPSPLPKSGESERMRGKVTPQSHEGHKGAPWMSLGPAWWDLQQFQVFLQIVRQIDLLVFGQESRLCGGENALFQCVLRDAQIIADNMIFMAERDARDAGIIGVDRDVESAFEHGGQRMRIQSRDDAGLIVAGHADFKGRAMFLRQLRDVLIFQYTDAVTDAFRT